MSNIDPNKRFWKLTSYVNTITAAVWLTSAAMSNNANNIYQSVAEGYKQEVVALEKDKELVMTKGESEQILESMIKSNQRNQYTYDSLSSATRQTSYAHLGLAFFHAGLALGTRYMARDKKEKQTKE